MGLYLKHTEIEIEIEMEMGIETETGYVKPEKSKKPIKIFKPIKPVKQIKTAKEKTKNKNKSKNKNKHEVYTVKDFNINLNPAKILSVFILTLFILTAGFFGIVDFTTPTHVTAFNITDLNKNGIIIYSDSDYSVLDDLFPFFSNYPDNQNINNRNSLKKSNTAVNSANPSNFNYNAVSVSDNINNMNEPARAAKEVQETKEISEVKTINNNTDNTKNLYENSVYTAKLFGIIPIKKVQVSLFPETTLIPGGMPFGVKFFTEGVIVVGLSDIETEKGTLNPAKTAGIKTSDIITEINGVTVNSVEQAAKIIEASEGETIHLMIVRDGKTYELKLKPVFSVSEAKFKSGIWLRDSTAGIGTVTFINPANYSFGGLGHGICDIDTGNLMPLKKGTIVNSVIENVVKGKSELPGELKGKFKDNMGTLLANTQNGIFGILNHMGNVPVSPENTTPLPIGLRSDIKEGRAVIYSTVDEAGIKEFEVEIIKIYKNSTDSKNFMIKVTDERLIEITGGIVQGMSGSPIIQNGKIIGAVTHVLVSDPTKGYGIFIDNMLASMPEILK